MVFNNNLLLGAAGQGKGYTIENSVRLDGVGDMSRTVGSDGDLREWSWSFWVKRSGLGTNGGLGFNIGGTYTDASNRSIVRFYSSGNGTDDFYWAERSGGAWREDQWTLAQYRDPSAWYHILLVWDTDGGTTPRARRYINGVQVTNLGSSPAAAANVDSGTNKAGTFVLFDQAGFPGREFEGYCAEMHFVDGTALSPTDFGEFNTDGAWVPKEVTGITYGSNGFYLDFADSSDLGKDVSGNSNDFTSSGLATTDQMLDTPTDNFCTMNPLNTDTDVTLSDGNLKVSWSSGTGPIVCGTMGVSSGKWYYEASFTGTFNFPAVGFAPTELSFGGDAFSAGTGTIVYYAPTGNQRGDGDNNAYGASYTVSDIIGVALNLDDNELTFYKNNTSQGTLNLSTLRSGYSEWTPLASGGGSVENIIMNFGQTAFTYTPPTGFNAVSTANLPDPTIADPSAYFQTLTYASTGTSTAFVQSGNSQFEPGLVWVKSRTGANNHLWFDQVRGATKFIRSDTTNVENTVADTLTAFNSNGFTAGADASNWGINYPGRNNVAWMWAADGTSGSSNTDGSITSTVSANTTAGFSIVKYAGNLSTTGSATVGHGLGTAPLVVISKSLDSTAGDSGGWSVQHTSLAASNILRLNTTAAASSKAANGTLLSPTSTVFYTNYTEGLNVTGNDYIAYCFAEVEGFSKIGSYTGNGSSNRPFIYTGFQPTFVLWKNASASGTDWYIKDTARDTYNVMTKRIYPNAYYAEDPNTSNDLIDMLSNGFKIRSSGNAATNGSGQTIIYMAFASSPFKTATAR